MTGAGCRRASGHCLWACLYRQCPVPIEAREAWPHHPKEPGVVSAEGETNTLSLCPGC